ncbi:MAG: hypothetical protein HY902_12630 [Deltaproteobacteria bacterium]|nr:hypothetical protein [Deltaproteobacteria bacterium]
MTVLWTAPAWAASPQIGPGREAEVLQLIAPYRDGADVLPGIRLQEVALSPTAIELKLQGPQGGSASLVFATSDGPRSFVETRRQASSPALEPALQALAQAVGQHDHGTFFANAPPLTTARAPSDVQAPAATAGWPTLTTALDWAALAAWLVLLLAMLAKALRPPRTWTTLVMGLLLWVVAAQVRHALPLTPLHADDHAFLELGLAAGAEPHGSRLPHLLQFYGPAWFQAQQWTAGLFGAHHDGVGHWAAAVSGLAVALAAVAARRASGRWLPALLAAAVCIWAPVAARVGHSESTLVVAQFLIAAVLWLASPPYPPRSGAWDLAGVSAGLALLCWGHSLGPIYAAGTGLCAWALAVRPRLSAAAGHPDPEHALPGPKSLASKLDWLPNRGTLLAGAVGGALALGAASWQFISQRALLGDRLGATESLLPVPGRFWAYLLWWNGDWAPTAFATLVVGFGFAGLYAQRRVHGRAIGAVTVAAYGLGTVVAAIAGLLVVACTTDAARYQAPLAPILLVVAGFAPRFAELLPASRQLPAIGAATFAQMIALVQLLMGLPARTALDAQGQFYAVLRHELASETAEITLVVPTRKPGERRHVVVDLPSGRWSPSGPTSHTMSADEFAGRCRQLGPKAAEHAWVALSPACAAVDLPGMATPCAELDALLDTSGPLRAGFVRPWAGEPDRGLAGEFHKFSGDSVPWRLGRARCP